MARDLSSTFFVFCFVLAYELFYSHFFSCFLCFFSLTNFHFSIHKISIATSLQI